jgi:hypothetical protein
MGRKSFSAIRLTLVFRIYKEVKKLNSKRIANQIYKWANGLNRQFSNEKNTND